MLTISRAGYNFGWSEMMTMPIRFLARFEEMGKYVLETEQAAFKT